MTDVNFKKDLACIGNSVVVIITWTQQIFSKYSLYFVYSGEKQLPATWMCCAAVVHVNVQ